MEKHFFIGDAATPKIERLYGRLGMEYSAG